MGRESVVGTDALSQTVLGATMDETRQNEGTGSRRSLGAILITDAAGFSALASRDEGKALDQLTVDMEIMRSCCERFKGRIIKSTGDGYLMFFDSAVLAVECALDVRAAMAVRTGEGLFQHRIGVHLGDVVLANDDAYGDGVNVASRLESAATPGSVLISQTVFDVIRGKVGCKCTFEGEKVFKGQAARIPVWSVSPGEGIVGGPRRHTPTWAYIATPVLLLVAIGLAIGSAQVRDRAASDVASARAERDQLLQVLASADGGAAMRQFDFPKMMTAVQSNTKPNDPEAKVLVKKLAGLNTWKGWLNKKIADSDQKKPVEVAMRTPTGVQKATVWNVEGKGIQLSDGHTVRTLEFKDFDPAVLSALSDSFKGLEPADRRKMIDTWSKDFKVIYGRRPRAGNAPLPTDTKSVRWERRQVAQTRRELDATLKEAQDEAKAVGFELTLDEVPDVQIPEPPKTAKTGGQ